MRDEGCGMRGGVARGALKAGRRRGRRGGGMTEVKVAVLGGSGAGKSGKGEKRQGMPRVCRRGRRGPAKRGSGSLPQRWRCGS